MTTDEGAEGPTSEAWADVPETATAPGIAFFRQHVDDLRLGSLDVQLLGRLENLATTTAMAIFRDRAPRDTLPTVFAEIDALRAMSDANAAPRQHILATRYVDNFLAYVAEMMSALFQVKPSALSSKEQVYLEDVLRHATIEEFVTWAADDRVNRLSYKGFATIAEYFEARFGLPLVENEDLRRDLIRGVAVRNLLVHRRGVVDRRFVNALRAEHIETAGYELGTVLTDFSTGETLPAITTAVRSIETRVVAKFGLPVLPTDAVRWWIPRPAQNDEAPQGR